MLTQEEAIHDTITINTKRLNKLTREDLVKMSNYYLIPYPERMRKAQIVKELSTIVTIDDFEGQ